MRKYLLILLLVSQFGNAQYNLFARQNFAKSASAPIYNTYIGGVSGTIATASALATKLGISVGAISNFTIVGSDIKCKITGSYGVPANAFDSNTSLTYYTDSDFLVTSLGAQCFIGCTNLSGKVNFANVVSVATDAFTNCGKITGLYLRNCTSLGTVVLRNCFLLKELYVPVCTNFGGTVGNDGIFNYPLLDCIIYAHPSLATNNSGGVDGDLAYAISQGAIVRYVTNFTAPNPVTTLAAGTIYNTAIQLNFTTPSAANAIDYYEVYANGVLKNKITASGDYVMGILASTNYDITIIAVDIYLNKSLVSNTLNVSTNTTSAVPTTNLVSYYKLDEVSGTTANDSKGTEHLTNTGITINQTGKVGKSYLSTIAGQRLETTTATPITGNFTINTWIYRTAAPGLLGGIFQQGDFSTNNGFGLWINSDGALSWRINQAYRYSPGTFVIPQNQWTMLTLVYNGTNVNVYIDAVLKITTAHTVNPNTTTKRTLFYQYNNTSNFIGNMDESCVYNAAITENQIKLLYNNGTGTTL